MQYFNRAVVPFPSYFREKEAVQIRKEYFDYYSVDKERRLQLRPPLMREIPYTIGVVDALDKLFKGKCSFCEQRTSLQPYLFRTSEDATPVKDRSTSHLYYGWLALCWDNIYHICNECSSGDRKFSPVTGRRTSLPTIEEVELGLDDGGSHKLFNTKEKNLLLDPCKGHKFYRHLDVSMEGELTGLTEAGRTTIEHFKLNRKTLVAKRLEVFHEYLQKLKSTIIENIESNISPDETITKIILNYSDLEYGGSWFLFLRKLTKNLMMMLNYPTNISRNGIRYFWRRYFPKKGFSDLQINGIIEQSLLNLTLQAETIFALEGEVYSPTVSKVADKYTLSPHKYARIKDIQYKNFKSLEKLSLKFPNMDKSNSEYETESLLILGENATGKSSLLEGIALALAKERDKQALKLSSARFLLNPEYMGSQRVQKKTGLVKLDFDNDTSFSLDLSLDRNIQDGIKYSQKELPPVFAYGAFRNYPNQDMGVRNRVYRKNPIDTLFNTHKLLNNPESWLLKLKKGDFNMVARALRLIFSIEEDFDVLHRNSNGCFIKTMVGINNNIKPAYTLTPLSIASSGYRAILAMVCDILAGLMDKKQNPAFENLISARAVVLIDEIEAHLHPSWKMQIMRGLRNALPQVTFIVTTHDPLCIRGMENGEVMVLNRIENTEEIEETDLPIFIENLTELPDVSNLTIEQLLTSEFFSLFTTDDEKTEKRFANIANILTKSKKDIQLNKEEEETLKWFEGEVGDALPIGSSYVRQLVQEAVAEHLKERKGNSQKNLKKLRVETKNEILKILSRV